MHQRILQQLIPVVLCCCMGHYAQAQKVVEPTNHSEEWTRAYQPFRIAGNLYYVGTYELSSYLITTPSGHILVNTGLSSSAAAIKKNMETLGFRFSDIKILLTNQAHFDHVGAMAAIQEMTGASFMVDAADAPEIRSGGKTDYAVGGRFSTFRPVKIARLLHNRDVVSLGDTKLLVLHHPGHTKGSCSFLVEVKDSSKTYKVLLANIPSIVTEKKFPEVTTYPQIAADYKYTLDTMPQIQFDIWVAAHASQFDLHELRKENTPYNPGAFANREAYNRILQELKREYEERIK